MSETTNNEPVETNNDFIGTDKKRNLKKKRGSFVNHALRLLVYCAIAGIVSLFFNELSKYTKVEWRRPLTSLVELVKYRNGEYQLRDPVLNKRISKRYDEVDITNAFKDSLLVLGKKGHYEILSLKTNMIRGYKKYGKSPWIKVFRPDSRGVVAVVCENNELLFVDVHYGAHRLPPPFPIQDRYPSLPEIRFQENGLCVIPHLDKGECLIDTQGNILVEGCREIDLFWKCYVRTTESSNGKQTLYRIRDMCPLVKDKEKIVVTPVGFCYLSNGRWYHTDTTGTQLLTDVVFDVYEGYSDYTGVNTLYEPEDEDAPSPYKTFMVNGTMGVFDEHYHIIIEPVWEEIFYLGDNLFSCVFDCNKAIILDKHGKILHQ